MTVDVSSTTPVGGYTFTVTGTSGSVAATATVCVVVGSGSCTSTSSTSGNFYILNSTTISGYNIVSGTLTALSGSPTALPTGVTPHSMAVDPTGSFLFVSTDLGIYLYDISSDGALTLDTSGGFGNLGAYAIQVDSTGHWLLAATYSLAGSVLY
ncbi:MAG: hypothetical protein ABR991_10000, partial [Terracidiphilus sp.]